MQEDWVSVSKGNHRKKVIDGYATVSEGESRAYGRGMREEGRKTDARAKDSPVRLLGNSFRRDTKRKWGNPIGRVGEKNKEQKKFTGAKREKHEIEERIGESSRTTKKVTDCRGGKKMTQALRPGRGRDQKMTSSEFKKGKEPIVGVSGTLQTLKKKNKGSGLSCLGRDGADRKTLRKKNVILQYQLKRAGNRIGRGHETVKADKREDVKLTRSISVIDRKGSKKKDRSMAFRAGRDWEGL